jgi:endonuclease I
MGLSLLLIVAIWAAAVIPSYGQVPQTVLYPHLTGNALMEQVRADYKPATVWSYNAARDRLFGDIDNTSNSVTCVYTSSLISVEAVITGARTRAFDATPSFNTEHVYPQSKGASTGNANSDLHHLMPVRADVNSSRGNSAFGFVATASVTRWWGPSGGTTTQPAPPLTPYSRTQSSSRFEPRDAVKGDIARAVFYFFTMYTEEALAADPNFFKGMMADLRAFHTQDAVNQAEYDRTTRIAGYQQNKPNPFIIDTTLALRIFYTDFTYPDDVPDGGDGRYTANWDAVSKTGYAAGTVTDNSVTWNLVSVLVGSDANDLRTGTKSLRAQVSADTRIEMQTNLPDGVGNVGFDAGRSNFSNDRSATAPTFILEVHVDGTWHAVGDPVNLNLVDMLTPYSFSVQEPGPSRIRVRVTGGTSGRRFNIDNVVITPFVPEEEELSIPIGTQTGWRMLTSPVSTTFASLLAPVWTQGAVGSDAPNAASNVRLLVDGAFTPVADLSTTLAAGQPFLYFHFNDDNYDGTTNSGASILSVTGPIPAGKKTVDASEAGFLLVGNPFATAVDFASVSRSGGALDKIWVYDPAQGRYVSRASGLGDFDGRIHPFQAFWVEASAAGSFGFDRGAQTASATFFGKSREPMMIRLRAQAAGRTDEAWVTLHPDASVDEDPFDAVKMTPLDTPHLKLSTRVGETRLGIQFIPERLDSVLRVPVEVVSTYDGAVSVSMEEVHLPAGWTARLESVDAVMTLIIDSGTSTSTPDAGRSTPDAIALHGAYPNPFNPTTAIRFTLDAGRRTRLAVYDVLGREVTVLIDGPMPAGAHSVTFDASTLTSGVYIVRLEAGGMSMTRRVTLLK